MELPEGCIAAILSRTTPVDAARLSVVSKTFRAAADSDVVWGNFLPSYLNPIMSPSPSDLANAPSKKEIYLAVSDIPMIIDDGKKSFQLDKKTGKNCYMLGSRDLFISWSNEMWSWGTSDPDSRFSEVAERHNDCWIQIRGMINTLSLSPNTQYGAFLVFKMFDAYSRYHCALELSVGIIGGLTVTKEVCLFFDGIYEVQSPTARSDGWLEIEIGEFFNSGLEDEEVHMCVMQMRDYVMQASHFVVEGIEVRPKEDN